MQYLIIVIALVFTLTTAGWSQNLPKPKKIPAPDSTEQKVLIQQGIALHDQKKYDEAVAKYKQVLDANPDSTMAMYEIALSLYTKGDKAAAKEMSLRGANYISDELPLFYGMIANILDDDGKPNEAVKLYRDAEEILGSAPDTRRFTSSIQYNLAITYFRQKKYTEARAEAKKSVESNFAYASPHYLLAVIFNGTKYKIPAFVAAARFYSLEYNSQRTKPAVDILTSVLAPAQKDPKTGNINIFMNLDGPKDEGEYGMYDLILGTITSVRGDDDKGKSDSQMFVEGIDSVIAMLVEDKKLSSTFVGKNYLPFLSEMKKQGHVPAFGYAVLYSKDNANAEAAKWLKDNAGKLAAFIDWAKAYSPARSK